MFKNSGYVKKCLFLTVSLGITVATIFGSIAQDSSTVISIYHTNDIHGCLNSSYNPDGKLLQIGMDVIKSIKDNDPNAILIDAGDASQGAMLASYSKGQKVFELMSEAGYDVMALGNHEFDYGINILKLNTAEAKFPIIAANVLTSEGKPFLENDKSNGCNIIKEIDGKKIGIFAVCTTETLYTTNADNIKGLVFENEISTSKKQVKELKQQGVDAIVAITHIGNLPSSLVKSEEIAKRVSGIDVIIDGHSHDEYSKKIGNTVIQQTGTKAKKIGKIDLNFDATGKLSVKTDLIKAGDIIDPNNPEALQYVPDENVRNICQSAMDQISSVYKNVLGKCENGLYGGNYQKTSICRITDTNLGNLMCDALIYEAKSLLNRSGLNDNIDIVSHQNGGGIRDSISSGYISMGDILNIFPFDNKVIIKKVSPKQLYEILENGVKSISIEKGMLTGTDGAFPSVGGMRIEFDIDGDPMIFNEEKDKIVSFGSRVKSIILLNEDGTDKKYLDREDTESEIAFISNSFATNGGDQYIMLKDIPDMTPEGNPLHIVLANYIKHLTYQNHGSFKYPANISRVHMMGKDELFSSFSANIMIKENSIPLSNGTVLVSIDGAEPFEAKTDSKGILKLYDLLPGAHDIRISKNRLYMNAYVNNKVGIKEANIFLEDKSAQDIEHIINIIDGIPKLLNIEDEAYILFARTSYDELSEEEKIGVTNYSVLEEAEKNINELSASSMQDEINNLSQGQRILYTSIILLVILSILFSALVYLKKRGSLPYK